MSARASASLAIFLISSGVSAATAAPASRCDATASAAQSSGNDRSLRDGLVNTVPTAGIFEENRNDQSALDEMLRGTAATRLHWERIPELVVLMPVMEYAKTQGTHYRATSQRLTDQEATDLAADLTRALVMLTDNAFAGFSAIVRHSVAPGEMVDVMRPGQIVVGRYSGVRDQLSTVGFGGRSTRGGTIGAGAIILDDEFDRTHETRRLLRMHELGHALGYNHVVSQTSIMNPKIGSEMTEFDRSAARIAFHGLGAWLFCS